MGSKEFFLNEYNLQPSEGIAESKGVEYLIKTPFLVFVCFDNKPDGLKLGFSLIIKFSFKYSVIFIFLFSDFIFSFSDHLDSLLLLFCSFFMLLVFILLSLFILFSFSFFSFVSDLL